MSIIAWDQRALPVSTYDMASFLALQNDWREHTDRRGEIYACELRGDHEAAEAWRRTDNYIWGGRIQRFLDELNDPDRFDFGD